MEFFEFLIIVAGAVLLMLGLMLIVENVFLKIPGRKVSPATRIIGAFAIVALLLSAVMLYSGNIIIIYVFLLSGVIIVFNRYWLGHFSTEQRK